MLPYTGWCCLLLCVVQDTCTAVVPLQGGPLQLSYAAAYRVVAAQPGDAAAARANNELAARLAAPGVGAREPTGRREEVQAHRGEEVLCLHCLGDSQVRRSVA